LSLDLSSITVIRALGSQAVRRLVAQLEPDVVFANEAEAAAVPLEDVPVAVVKLGDRGVLLNGTLHQATAVEMVDTTGAGDAMAAGFLFGGIELGLAAAARAVSQTGALPAGKPATAGKAGAPLGAGATTWR
jgi:sugar/nucleoside kinase (ribokinase family)